MYLFLFHGPLTVVAQFFGVVLDFFTVGHGKLHPGVWITLLAHKSLDRFPCPSLPIPSMVAWYIYLHKWLMFMVNVGKYAIHGCYGLGILGYL